MEGRKVGVCMLYDMEYNEEVKQIYLEPEGIFNVMLNGSVRTGT